MEYLASVVGIAGSGKSTAVRGAASLLTQQGIKVAAFHDRKSDPWSRRIDEIIQGGGIVPLARHFLYLAARSQVIASRIRPALSEHDVVFTDRYYPCSIAYQGHGEGLDLEMITASSVAAAADALPNRVFVLDTPVSEAAARMGARGEAPQALEGQGVDFDERVRRGYLAQAEGRSDYTVLDGRLPPDEIASRVAAAVLTDLECYPSV
jgi:dTMP kinase